MPSDEAKRLIREERLSVDSVQEGAKLISKPEYQCGGKIAAKIGKDVNRDEIINEAASRIAEADDVFKGKLSPRLEKVMIKTLHVSIADVERMTKKERHELYDKACTYEEIKAVEASETTKEGCSPDAEDAAHIVDWLWSLREKPRP